MKIRVVTTVLIYKKNNHLCVFRDASMLIVDLGNLRVASEKQERAAVSPKSTEAVSRNQK